MGCPFDNPDGPEVLIAFAAGRLAREKEIELERHLEACPKCRETARAQKAVWAALETWPAIEVSPDFDRRLYQQMDAGRSGRWWQRPFWTNWSWRPAVPVAAACAALLAAFLLKTPALHPSVPLQNEPKLQIEQVEHALDDMEMLKQLSQESAPERAHGSERI